MSATNGGVGGARGGDWRWVSRAPSGVWTASVQAGGTGPCESLYILLYPHDYQEGFLD